MKNYADKTQENQSQSVANVDTQKQGGGDATFQFVDNSPEAIAQRKLQEMADNSPEAMQMKAFQKMANDSPEAKKAAQLQAMADNSSEAKETAQLQAMADNHSAEEEQATPKQKNNTGLPDKLKAGIENLSGYSMDDVKVHRNSDKPAQLQAHAYAQGTDIHLGPGQEKHLPHEAWHVAQQKDGRVKPTMQMKGDVNVNDDGGLEKEADVMGAKALQFVAPEGELKESESGVVGANEIEQTGNQVKSGTVQCANTWVQRAMKSAIANGVGVLAGLGAGFLVDKLIDWGDDKVVYEMLSDVLTGGAVYGAVYSVVNDSLEACGLGVDLNANVAEGHREPLMGVEMNEVRQGNEPIILRLAETQHILANVIANGLMNRENE